MHVLRIFIFLTFEADLFNTFQNSTDLEIEEKNVIKPVYDIECKTQELPKRNGWTGEKNKGPVKWGEERRKSRAGGKKENKR